MTPPNAASNPWERIARTPEYRQMTRTKNRFVIAATVFFVVYYFALPILVGYWPELMNRRVVGVVNLAYLFAFSQFLMAWALAYLYLRMASRFDRTTVEILAKAAASQGVE